MAHPLHVLIHEYGWIHTGIGVLGNTAFFAGSLFFLPALEAYKTVGVWLFIVGALFMLIGAAGNMAVKYWNSGSGAPSRAGRRGRPSRPARPD
ncbi:YrhK family protein [Marinicauda pacifica]|uniref:YrhK family protein n=1 Tax=Marinicauda pacifica TaxID=1133559 RepID=UPI0035C832A3